MLYIQNFVHETKLLALLVKAAEMAEVDFQAGELDGVEGGSGVGSQDEHADANAVRPRKDVFIYPFSPLMGFQLLEKQGFSSVIPETFRNQITSNRDNYFGGSVQDSVFG